MLVQVADGARQEFRAQCRRDGQDVKRSPGRLTPSALREPARIFRLDQSKLAPSPQVHRQAPAWCAWAYSFVGHETSHQMMRFSMPTMRILTAAIPRMVRHAE